MKPHKPRWLLVSDRRNSTIEGINFLQLDWSEWWQDQSNGCNYLHVYAPIMGTWHRVHCKHAGAPRIGSKNGRLYWIV